MVFGERRSGTNFLDRTVAGATGLAREPGYGWKHGPPVVPVLPSHVLFLVIVRDPLEWLASLYRAPYELHPDLQSLDFASFLRTPWRGVFKAGLQQWDHFGYAPGGAGAGEDLQLDRHPLTGRLPTSPMELRRIKLTAHLSLLERGVNAAVLRYEDLRDRPDATLGPVLDAFGVARTAPVEPPRRIVSPNAFAGEDRRAEWTEANRATALAGLDPAQERRLGYLLEASGGPA
jgi:hypothetical protein